MKETLIDLKSRRSCRAYKPEQPSQEELQAVLDTAVYSPTGRGQQSPVMVVVQDPAVMAQLSELNGRIMDAKRDPFYGAPTAVIVFADSSSHTGAQDAALLMGTLMNAAHAVGLGSCWINRAKEMFAMEEMKPLRSKWGLADKYEGMAICILGYEAEGGIHEPKPRKADYIIWD